MHLIRRQSNCWQRLPNSDVLVQKIPRFTHLSARELYKLLVLSNNQYILNGETSVTKFNSKMCRSINCELSQPRKSVDFASVQLLIWVLPLQPIAVHAMYNSKIVQNLL